MNIVDDVAGGRFNELLKHVLKRCYKMTKTPLAERVSLILIDDGKMRGLNAAYRGKDATTDVLTFPAGVKGDLGDIFISVPQMQKQAASLGHSQPRELAILTIHGFLHACGHTHDDDASRKTMFDLQAQILNTHNFS